MHADVVMTSVSIASRFAVHHNSIAVPSPLWLPCHYGSSAAMVQFGCTLCAAVYQYSKDLRKHVRDHHADEEVPAELLERVDVSRCPQCN